MEGTIRPPPITSKQSLGGDLAQNTWPLNVTGHKTTQVKKWNIILVAWSKKQALQRKPNKSEEDLLYVSGFFLVGEWGKVNKYCNIETRETSPAIVFCNMGVNFFAIKEILKKKSEFYCGVQGCQTSATSHMLNKFLMCIKYVCVVGLHGVPVLR